MATLSTAFSQAAGHQADAVRTQSDANVRVADIEAHKQLELAKLHHSTQHLSIKVGGWIAGSVLVFLAALVTAAFFTGHPEIATHVIAAVGAAVPVGFAAWFAAKARR